MLASRNYRYQNKWFLCVRVWVCGVKSHWNMYIVHSKRLQFHWLFHSHVQALYRRTDNFIAMFYILPLKSTCNGSVFITHFRRFESNWMRAKCASPREKKPFDNIKSEMDGTLGRVKSIYPTHINCSMLPFHHGVFGIAEMPIAYSLLITNKVVNWYRYSVSKFIVRIRQKIGTLSLAWALQFSQSSIICMGRKTRPSFIFLLNCNNNT